MIIQSDSVRMGASRTYRANSSNYATLRMWDNTSGNTTVVNMSNQSQVLQNSQQLSSFLTDAQRAYEESLSKTDDSEEEAAGGNGSEDSSSLPDSMQQLFAQFQATQNVGKNGLVKKAKQLEDVRNKTMSYLLFLLFGDKAKKLRPLSEIKIDEEENPDYTSYTSGSTVGIDTSPHTGGIYYSSTSYSERESTSFSAKGTVVTADGRELDFNIGVTMSRSFIQTYSSQLTFGEEKLVDPLVINLGTDFASVSDQKFYFDIDADGTQEEISQLSSGSGYLALDKNGDGMINDGSELFGAKSGNGFADLAAYDEDGNGWIDEADSIFSKLRIWTRDADGKDHLYGLGESNVGAIYLGSSETEFSLKDGENNTNAVIRQTGIFLYENGNVGTIQQMDLAT